MVDYKSEDLFLLVDKPKDWTSFDVVKKLKYALKPKKIGHAGTLDPLATGLLVLGVNKFTKKIEEVQAQTKTYTGIIEIGKTTPSYDLETAFDSERDWSHIDKDEVKSASKAFIGEIEQTPPAHSAIKVDGVRAYKMARNNEEVKLKARKVKIYSLELTQIDLPEIHFEVVCSKGTYIRSLANDLGKKLGVGAYLKALVRTKIGDFTLESARSIEEIISDAKQP